MEMMIKDPKNFTLVDEQLEEYNQKRGFFGCRAALQSFKTRSPVEWWLQFGDDVPELKSFATRVLGLTCSTSACERNWSAFNQVHTKRRNCLSTMNLNRLVYIMYNRRLKNKHLRKQSKRASKSDDPLFVEDLPCDDDWIANPNPNDDEVEDDSLDVELDIRETSCPEPSKKKRKTKTTSDKGKRKVDRGLVDEEEEEFGGGENEDGDEDLFYN